MATMKEIIRGVRKHATKNYNEGGWDFLVDCWDDTDIEEIIGGCTTLKAAITECAEVFGELADCRQDVQTGTW